MKKLTGSNRANCAHSRMNVNVMESSTVSPTSQERVQNPGENNTHNNDSYQFSKKPPHWDIDTLFDIGSRCLP